jgi:hypothetical protein
MPSSDASNCIPLVCHHTCKTCWDDKPGSCASCFVHASMSGPAPSACVCSPNHLPVPDASNCEPILCHKTCLSCSGPSASQCITCVHIDAFSDAGACKCKPGFFSSPDSTNCIKSQCHESCATCSGGSQSDCMTCHANATLAGTAPHTCV